MYLVLDTVCILVLGVWAVLHIRKSKSTWQRFKDIEDKLVKQQEMLDKLRLDVDTKKALPLGRDVH